MVLQLLIGSTIIVLSVALTAAFIGTAISVLRRFGPWLTAPPYARKAILALIGVTTWLLLALSISVWLWALLFLILDLFDGLEPALYFSIVVFTTLGFGDITLPEPWRLLSGMSAANGLLLFGLCTAFLAEFLVRLRQAQEKERTAA